ncbi:glycosyltransferase [Sphingomonas aerolata]|uniref:glycosyltransferase n=1 Tax=Sphingomonas aerolata TaxID=185951 RepID=UPI002FE2AE40
MTARPKISFVVPTLNRGRYVVRAVDSCLAAATAAVDVEVVVLDSMSDDGSWDLLTERFAGIPASFSPRTSAGWDRHAVGSMARV